MFECYSSFLHTNNDQVSLYQMAKPILVALAFLLFEPAKADTEMCLLEALSDRPYTDLECQFYLGTTAYRAESYSVAAAHWRNVINSPNISADTASLKSTAQSTLGYLTYYGLGVPQDRQSAVESWNKAAQGGSMEARHQLGSAYADPAYSGHNRVLALAWYYSLVFAHPDLDDLRDMERSLHESAQAQIETLEAQMSDLEISVARQKASELVP
jgi:TPR repeat protein